MHIKQTLKILLTKLSFVSKYLSGSTITFSKYKIVIDHLELKYELPTQPVMTAELSVHVSLGNF